MILETNAISHVSEYPKDYRVVVIGGGSGSSVILQALKRYTIKLTAVVTMFDSGGSSGLLHAEFGHPPLGDLRQCLLALSGENETTRSLRNLVGFRFNNDSSLHGHSLGNLLLAALNTLGDDLELAIDEMGHLLHIAGQVIPVALQSAELCAVLEDGRLVQGESNIDLRGESSPKIKHVFLEPTTTANPKAINAILEADIVVLGPGDLYTSIIPNLLVQGVPEALSATTATRVYVCNLMTKLGETDCFKASDFVREINRYLGGPHLDWALINTDVPTAPILDTYLAQGSRSVEADLDLVEQYVPGVFAGRMGNCDVPFKHEPDLIGQLVLRTGEIGRINNFSIVRH